MQTMLTAWWQSVQYFSWSGSRGEFGRWTDDWDPPRTEFRFG